jgi:hypothetical protein
MSRKLEKPWQSTAVLPTVEKEEEDSLIFKFPATNSKEMSIVEIRRVFKYLNPVLTTCIYLSSVFRVMS